MSGGKHNQDKRKPEEYQDEIDYVRREISYTHQQWRQNVDILKQQDAFNNITIDQLRNENRMLEKKLHEEQAKRNQLEKTHSKTVRGIEHNATEEIIGMLKDDIKRLQTERDDKEKQIVDLESNIGHLDTRISSFASKQLTEGNPDFTDLSDINRPVRLAERFHKIYDYEWTTSLESLTKVSINLTEDKAISVLMDIIKSIYAFCTNYAQKQTEKMVKLWIIAVNDPFASASSVGVTSSSGSSPNPSKAVVDEFKQHRKSFHKECIRMAIMNFKENVITATPQIDKNWLPAVDAYIDVCVEVLWLMCVQNPPMVIKWPEPDSKFDSENYKKYCKKGKIVKLAVWPAVFLNDNGPLMNKGYAMPA